MFYFDHSATTPVHPSVLNLINKVQKEFYANPSSVHTAGKKAKAIIEVSRTKVASAINANPEQIIFTSGGTESNNQVFWSMLNKSRSHVISNKIEHPAVIKVLKYLNAFNLDYSLINVDKNGLINLEELKNQITDQTSLVSIMMSNNEIGTIQPIKEVVKVLQNKNILMHTDAVQCFGKIDIDVGMLGIDFLSLSAHKFYGPKGLGILYVKNKKTIKNLLIGGSQEYGLRGGTENVASIAGAGLAAEIGSKNLKKNAQKLMELKKYFIKELKTLYPSVIINGHLTKSLPGLINVSFPGFRSDILMAKLDRVNIAVSSGSACGSGSVKPSPVLSEIGISEKLNLSSLRISFGSTNNINEVKILLKELNLILNN